MPHVSSLVKGNIVLDSIFEANNLEFLYDTRLVDCFANDEAASLELRGQIPFMPVVVDAGNQTSFVPIADHETPLKNYMGLLVAESKILEGLFVVRFLPYPVDTPHPNRILSFFGSKVERKPITGFITAHDSRLHGPQLAVVYGQNGQKFEIDQLKLKHSVRTVAGLVLDACKKAQRLNRKRLK